jgi:hypothetical protein
MPIFNPNTGRFDIEPRKRREAPEPFWAQGSVPKKDPVPLANFAIGVLGIGGIVAYGRSSIGQGRRGVDRYHQWIRAIEDSSPGGMFRTFGVSDLTYPFTAGAPRDRGLVARVGGKLAQGLEAVYPDQLQRFRQGKQRFVGLPVSSKTRQLVAMSRAYASSQMQRFNSLLQEMRELSILKDVPGFVRTRDYVASRAARLGLKLPPNVLGVKPGPALRMLGGYAGKAAAVGLGIHYLNYLDYLRRSEDSKVLTTAGGALAGAAGFGAFFRNVRAARTGAMVGAAIGLLPTFDEGIYAGFASLYTKGRLLHAKMSDHLGLTDAVERQEDLAPGITQAKTVLGFAGAGGLTNYLFQYSKRLTKGGVQAKGFGKGALVGLGIYAAMAGLTAIASGTIIPGILGSEKSHDELQKIYSGEEEVPIRKGRWWEFGRTPWEGTKVDYYRAHWYPRLLSGARDTSIYGSEEEKWAYDPILHPVKALFDEEFKYHRELRNYHSRPYPVSGTYFEDIPFLGPILAGTLGKLIKPTRYMHTKKWLRGGELGEPGSEVYDVPHAGGHEPVAQLGGETPATPLTRYDSTDMMGKTIYRLNELRGLTGFAHGAIKEHLTGSQDYFDQTRRLESATRAYGLERWFWDMNLGGLLGTTEALRRYIPHRRRQIDLYNPIPNLMPSWMPGSNYYIDFHTGDPYTKVPEGDIRLPGRGYEKLNPELRGLHPEEYPLFHRFKILADTAMWSDEYKQARDEMRAAQKAGKLSVLEVQQFQTILQQVSSKKKKREFKEYRFATSDAIRTDVTVKELLPEGRFTTEEFSDVQFDLSGVNLSTAARERLVKKQERSGTIRSRMEELFNKQQTVLEDSLKAGQKISVLVPGDPLSRYKMGARNISMPVIVDDLNKELIDEGLAEFKEDDLSQYLKYSPMQRGVATAWEILTHKGETPVEIITPFAPMTKFVHARSAIEEYERTQVFGTTSAFWQHPVEHFLVPFYQSVRSLVDSDYIPERIEHRREVQEYFDKLKYVKYARLERIAKEIGETEISQELYNIKRQTLFGVDPYGSFSNILKALPGAERDFFTAFTNARTAEERERILELLPPNERHIYIARWHGRLARQLMAEYKADITQDTTLLAELSRFKKYEGKPYTPQLEDQYEKTKESGQSYADWYRSRELETYFSTAPLPGPNWVGWHPKVDLDDIKLKVIESMGEDMHDYGLWQSRARTLERKPYIGEDAIAPIMGEPEMARGEMVDRLRALLTEQNITGLQITSHNVFKNNYENEIEIDILDDREIELQEYVRNPNRE